MIRSRRPGGVVGAILSAISAFVVLGIVYAGSAVAGERPTGKRTHERSLRSPTDTRSVPIDISPMRMRVETREGVLVVFDAAAPPEADEGCSGYIGYWLSARDKTQYVFPEVLRAEGDLGTVLLALERDLGVDLEALADLDDRVDRALSAVAETPNEEIVWEPATLHRAVEIMGFDAEDELTGVDEPYDGGVAAPCQPCAASLPPPGNCGSPGGLAGEALAVTAGCCGDGGGVPPPGDGGDPCGGDPYCGGPCGHPCCAGPCNCPNDKDCDRKLNGDDDDVDGDGIPNGSDPDVDGDGALNGSDPDVDGDGILNRDDPNVDGDDILNGSDSDVDGDGLSNGVDGDIDGDGLRNGSDPDPDGDGLLNADDPDDDGDGLPDGSDPEPEGCTTDCPGPCCTKATGACSSKKESECTGTDKYFKGKEEPCSPNPCCAFGTNNPFNPQSASAYEVARGWTWTDAAFRCLRGATVMERIEVDDVSISSVCNGTQWCAVLLGLKGQYSQGWRMLPGQEDVTGPGGNTTSSNFCAQVLELRVLGFPSAECTTDRAGAWYMLEAVKRHELVHSRSMQDALKAIAPAVEISIEGLCVPQPGKTRDDAIAEIRLLPAFTTAVEGAFTDWADRWRSNPDRDSPGGPEDQEAHTVVDPMWQWICSHAESQCWPVCSACPPRAIGGCCNPTNGGCTTKTRCDCVVVANGGIYQGDDITCGPPNPCVGACCPNGVGPSYPCTLTTASGCSGPFVGLGTDCTANPCEPPG